MEVYNNLARKEQEGLKTGMLVETDHNYFKESKPKKLNRIKKEELEEIKMKEEIKPIEKPKPLESIDSLTKPTLEVLDSREKEDNKFINPEPSLGAVSGYTDMSGYPESIASHPYIEGQYYLPDVYSFVPFNEVTGIPSQQALFTNVALPPTDVNTQSFELFNDDEYNMIYGDSFNNC